MTADTQRGSPLQSYGGSERRSRQISDAEVKFIAEAAAEQAISNLFEIFGVDVTTQDGRKGVQDDFTWVRDARTGTAGMRKAGSVAVIGALVTGATYALWKGLVTLSALAAKGGP